MRARPVFYGPVCNLLARRGTPEKWHSVGFEPATLGLQVEHHTTRLQRRTQHNLWCGNKNHTRHAVAMRQVENGPPDGQKSFLIQSEFILVISTANVRNLFLWLPWNPTYLWCAKKNHTGTLMDMRQVENTLSDGQKSFFFIQSEFYIGHFDRQREDYFFCGFLGTQHNLWCGKKSYGHAVAMRQVEVGPRWAKVFFYTKWILFWAFRPPNVRETFFCGVLGTQHGLWCEKIHTGTLWPCARSKIGPQMGKSLFLYKLNFILGHFDRQCQGNIFCGFLGTQHNLWSAEKNSYGHVVAMRQVENGPPDGQKSFFYTKWILYWSFRTPTWGKLILWLPWNLT